MGVGEDFGGDGGCMTWVSYYNYWGMETLFGDARKWVFGTRGGARLSVSEGGATLL